MDFTNQGTIDRIARIVLGLGGLYAGYSAHSFLFGGVGAVVLVSGLMGFCPMYTLFGLNTGLRK